MRYLKRATLDILEKFRPICAEIWWHTYNHFVKENTQQVPINALSVALTLQHFRGKVSNRATERLGLLRATESLFGETKVCQKCMAVFVKNYVVWLEISENNVILV